MLVRLPFQKHLRLRQIAAVVAQNTRVEPEQEESRSSGSHLVWELGAQLLQTVEHARGRLPEGRKVSLTEKFSLA